MIPSLTGSSDSKILNKWSYVRPYTTGIDVEASAVFCIAKGRVSFLGQDTDGKWTLTVAINELECIRYCNLSSVNVTYGHILEIGDKIGQCSNYVHIEYCTVSKGKSVFVVRVHGNVYYKQDPTPLLDGSYTPAYEERYVERNATPPKFDLDVSPDVYQEFNKPE